MTAEWLAEQLRKASCTKCLEDRDHPWHDDGTPNPDDRYEPYVAPRHLPEDNDE